MIGGIPGRFPGALPCALVRVTLRLLASFPFLSPITQGISCALHKLVLLSVDRCLGGGLWLGYHGDPVSVESAVSFLSCSLEAGRGWDFFFSEWIFHVEDLQNTKIKVYLGEKVRHTFLYNLSIVIKIYQL